MTCYRNISLPLVLIGSAAVAALLAVIVIGCQRKNETEPQKATLDEWEEEGGNIAGTPLP